MIAAYHKIRLNRTRSSHFDEPFALLDQGFNLRQQRLEPLEQGTATGVADAKPENGWSGTALQPVRKVLVLGDEDGLVFHGIAPDRGIVGVPQTNVGDVLGLMAPCGQQPGEGGWKLGVDDEAHGSPGDQNGVVRLGGGVFQTGPDVFGSEVGIVFENFAFPHSGGEQVEHVLDPDAHAPDARPSTALVRVEGDPVHDGAMIAQGRGQVKGVNRRRVHLCK